MNMSLKSNRYFRSLELAAFVVGLAMALWTGMSYKWIGFSRIVGTYLGVFFLPIALLELSALFAERYGPEKTVSRSTLLVSLFWTLLVIVPVIRFLSLFPLYRGAFASAYLWHIFPDDFSDLLGGSAFILAVWILPVAILSNALKILKRRREEEIRWGVILWQIAFLAVVLWAFGLQKIIHSRIVNIAGSYFSPLEMHFGGSFSVEVVPMLNFALVLLFWSVLFVVLRYSVRYFGAKNSLIGLCISIAAATLVIVLPAIPPLPSKRFVDFVNYSGWYSYRAPRLIPLRIWVASLMFVGVTVVVAGLGWLLHREKSTVQSG